MDQGRGNPLGCSVGGTQCSPLGEGLLGLASRGLPLVQREPPGNDSHPGAVAPSECDLPQTQGGATLPSPGGLPDLTSLLPPEGCSVPLPDPASWVEGENVWVLELQPYGDPSGE
ncbi:coiled-coil domain-containing protein 22 [Platysternon megacephalum]|uniref:Coiled-coil domain-containing protein 22 n=1 Tax=Platysternon megacephalum TaxID=55544 RepID=A0A4D9DJD4_9SAUR|nr:coiled-coil domain-containing protein 22 [Platysternon megacephalum]